MMNGNTSDGVGGGLRARREAVHLSQLAVALRADCSPAMVGLVDRGYRPHRSAVIERIDRVLSDAEALTDVEPAENGLDEKERTTNAHESG